MFHDRSKHIDIKYHFIWYMVKRVAIRLHPIRVDEQVVDTIMRPLGKVKFLTLCEKFGVMERPMRVPNELDNKL